MSKEYNMALIKSTELLDNVQNEQLILLQSDLRTSFERIETRRPKYIMEVSVLDSHKFVTPDAKYWQSLLERDVQFRNLLTLALDYKEKIVDIKIKNAEIDEFELTDITINNARAEKIKIQIQRDELELTFMQKDAKDRYHEIINWTDVINSLKSELKYPEDDPYEHLSDSMPKRFAEQTRLIKMVGASDMNGAMNIIGLHESAIKYSKDKDNKK